MQPLNFQLDLYEYADRRLQEYPTTHRRPGPSYDSLVEWCHLLRKIPSPTPRTVVESQHLVVPAEHRAGYDQLVTKIRGGSPVWRHLSWRCFCLDKGHSDGLYNDWGITHLHLGTHQGYFDRRFPDRTDFVQRTDHLALVFFSRTSAHIVDVVPHLEGSEWAEQNIIQRVHDEWPHLIRHKAVTGLPAPREQDRFDAQSRGALRKAGLIQPTYLADTMYVPVTGQTTSGLLVAATKHANNWLNYAEAIKLRFLSDYEEILQYFTAKGHVFPDAPAWKLSPEVDAWRVTCQAAACAVRYELPGVT